MYALDDMKTLSPIDQKSVDTNRSPVDSKEIGLDNLTSQSVEVLTFTRIEISKNDALSHPQKDDILIRNNKYFIKSGYKKIDIPMIIANQMKLIGHLIKDYVSQPYTINVEDIILEKIIEFGKLYYIDNPSLLTHRNLALNLDADVEATRSQLRNLRGSLYNYVPRVVIDNIFELSSNNSLRFDLFIAANYLNFKRLIEDASLCIAFYDLKGCTPMDLVGENHFNIWNEFSEADKKKHMDKYKWFIDAKSDH